MNRHSITNWRFWLYNGFLVLYSPFIFLKKWHRSTNKNNDWEFDLNRWRCPVKKGNSHAHSSQEQQPHIVFISNGFGEMKVIEQLSQQLLTKNPTLRTTWALRRGTTLEIIQQEHPEQDVTYTPFDFCIPVWNWYRNLSPDVVVIVEKLFLPNLIWTAKHWGAKVIVVNGKSSARRGKFLTRIMQRWSLAGVDEICLQSKEELKKIEPLLKKDANVHIVGQVKFNFNNNAQIKQSADLKEWIGNDPRPLIVAGSIHSGEEEIVLKAFLTVKREMPCRLLIAPRHLHDTLQFVQKARTFGFDSVSLRTQFVPQNIAGKANSTSQVLILDTLGELNEAYSMAQATFVGGTMNGPGHNILEPLSWGVPVSFGPGRGTPTPMQQEVMQAGIGVRIHNADELAKNWLDEIRDPQQRIMKEHKIKEFSLTQKQILEKNVDAMLSMIKNKR